MFTPKRASIVVTRDLSMAVGIQCHLSSLLTFPPATLSRRECVGDEAWLRLANRPVERSLEASSGPTQVLISTKQEAPPSPLLTPRFRALTYTHTRSLYGVSQPNGDRTAPREKAAPASRQPCGQLVLPLDGPAYAPPPPPPLSCSAHIV